MMQTGLSILNGMISYISFHARGIMRNEVQINDRLEFINYIGGIR